VVVEYALQISDFTESNCLRTPVDVPEKSIDFLSTLLKIAPGQVSIVGDYGKPIPGR
jgi:hypothetical protein